MRLTGGASSVAILSSRAPEPDSRLQQLPCLVDNAGMKAKIRWLLPLFGALVALPSGPAAADAGDAEFSAARSAYEQADRARLDALAPRLATHVLRPYVDYWRLRLGLGSATDEDVRAFVDAGVAPPLVEQLRVEWLKLLGRQGQWSRFAVYYPPPAGEDAELACLGVQYRRQRDGDAALAAAKPLWFTGQTLPDTCDPVFDALIRSGELSVADRRERFRLATQAGNLRLARAIAAEFPPGARIVPEAIGRVDADPVRALERGAFPWREPGGRELALFALERAARTDAGAVRPAWERQRRNLPDADRRYGNARLAYHAARQLHAQANAWFSEAGEAPLSDTEQAWRARAALRAGDWAALVAAVDRMPPRLAGEQAWRYWRARGLAATGHGDAAQQVYTALAVESTFYGLLAAEALGRGEARMQEPRRSGPPVDPSLLSTFGARADVRRVVKLAELDLRQESQREWVQVLRGADDDLLLLAADYARRVGLYDRAINTAERTGNRHDFSLRYLTPYKTEFATAAREHQVDEALLFGIARQESRFNADIVSSAGAVGLMQLMPATARWVARELKRDDFRPTKIADIGTNTTFGAFYFKHWLERLDSQPALAAAAYNAGPGRAQTWRQGAPLEGAVWVETIPFNETRDYVKKVLANTMFYARELEQPYVPLTVRLGTVTPRDAGSGASAKVALSPN
jgi:soluble lytic murein transglycosylase